MSMYHLTLFVHREFVVDVWTDMELVVPGWFGTGAAAMHARNRCELIAVTTSSTVNNTAAHTLLEFSGPPAGNTFVHGVSPVLINWRNKEELHSWRIPHRGQDVNSKFCPFPSAFSLPLSLLRICHT
jgi:hypothetical protein